MRVWRNLSGFVSDGRHWGWDLKSRLNFWTDSVIKEWPGFLSSICACHFSSKVLLFCYGVYYKFILSVCNSDLSSRMIFFLKGTFLSAAKWLHISRFHHNRQWRTLKLLIGLFRKQFWAVHQIPVYVCNACLLALSSLRRRQRVGMMESLRPFAGIKLHSRHCSLIFDQYINYRTIWYINSLLKMWDVLSNLTKDLDLRLFQHKARWEAGI